MAITSEKAVEVVPLDQQRGLGTEKIRKTDHYKAEYVHSFVEKWDELID